MLGAALLALLFSSDKVRLPPIKLPLSLFMLGTVVALLASGDVRDGIPQVRKFFVFFVLLLVYSTFRSIREIRAVTLLWAGVATLSALFSLVQFWRKFEQSRELHRNFYDFYIAQRITGFMSHWMTFGAEEMIVLLMLAAYLFFSIERRWKVAGWACAAVLVVSMVLGLTRSIFLLGFPLGFLYLCWFWRRWVLVAVPVVAALSLVVAPPFVRERVESVLRPGAADSNQFRVVTRRTGMAMIEAHPWLGLGPEQVGRQFRQWVPADVSRPLPDGYYGHLHNIYLQYAAERGIPTMLAMMWLIGKVLWDFARALRGKLAKTEARFVLHGAIAVILAILAEGFLEYNLGDSEVLTLFLAVVSFGYVALAESTSYCIGP